jgi:hypothetical protein
MRKIFLSCVLAVMAVSAYAKVTIIPYPQQVVENEGSYKLAGVSLRSVGAIDERTQALVERFAAELSQATGKSSKVIKGKAGKGINFIYDQTMAEEAYVLNVGTKSIDIKASSYAIVAEAG